MEKQDCQHCFSETTEGKKLFGELLCPSCFAAESEFADEAELYGEIQDAHNDRNFQPDTEDHLFDTALRGPYSS